MPPQDSTGLPLYGPTSTAILDAFVAGGGNFIDTADAYSAFVPGNSGGESGTIIGEWLQRTGRRKSYLAG